MSDLICETDSSWHLAYPNLSCSKFHCLCNSRR